jgi:hypothetical protein
MPSALFNALLDTGTDIGKDPRLDHAHERSNGHEACPGRQLSLSHVLLPRSGLLRTPPANSPYPASDRHFLAIQPYLPEVNFCIVQKYD